MSKETWKPVLGYESYYRVSDLGAVKSIKRNVRKSNGTEITYKSKLLKPQNGMVYQHYTLSKGGKCKTIMIHRIVAQSFLGEIPNNMVVDHIDNNPHNNKLSNLQVITQQLNASKDKKGKLPTGVYKNGSNFSTKITINKKRLYIGTFKTVEEARNAYISKLTKLN